MEYSRGDELMTQDAMRVAFEAWAETQFSKGDSGVPLFKRQGFYDEDYYHGGVQQAWRAWRVAHRVAHQSREAEVQRLREENAKLRGALADIMRSKHPNPSYIARQALSSVDESFRSIKNAPSQSDADSNGDVLFLRSGGWECLGKWNKVPVDASAWMHTDRYRQALTPAKESDDGK